MTARGFTTFLDAAVTVLEEASVPLSPTQITEKAISRALIPADGKTPSQTMKAKLSTDILRRRDASRFMRTEKNVFALRAWRDRYTEYVADRYQKALLDEEIVVFDRAILERFVPRTGVHTLDRATSDELLSHVFSMQRREAEEDPSVIQLVSAFVVRIGDRVATYKRTRRLPESRLHGYYSLIFGGHLNPEDVPPLFSIFDPHIGPLFIARELSEELRFSEPPRLELIGVIYDTRREVSTQHLGVLYDVYPHLRAKIEIGERGFLQQLRFETPAEIEHRLDDFENWSELVLREHLLAVD